MVEYILTQKTEKVNKKMLIYKKIRKNVKKLLTKQNSFVTIIAYFKSV